MESDCINPNLFNFNFAIHLQYGQNIMLYYSLASDVIQKKKSGVLYNARVICLFSDETFSKLIIQIWPLLSLKKSQRNAKRLASVVLRKAGKTMICTAIDLLNGQIFF